MHNKHSYGTCSAVCNNPFKVGLTLSVQVSQ